MNQWTIRGLFVLLVGGCAQPGQVPSVEPESGDPATANTTPEPVSAPPEPSASSDGQPMNAVQRAIVTGSAWYTALRTAEIDATLEVSAVPFSAAGETITSMEELAKAYRRMLNDAGGAGPSFETIDAHAPSERLTKACGDRTTDTQGVEIVIREDERLVLCIATVGDESKVVGFTDESP